jgi:hypothetical protein
MDKKVSVYVAVLAAVLAAVGVVAGSWSVAGAYGKKQGPPAPKAERAPSEERAAPLEGGPPREPPRIMARVAVPETQKPEPEKPKAKPESANEDTDEGPPPGEAEREAYARAVFDSEPVDINWARATQSDLTTRLGAINAPGAAVREVSCKSSLCRVSLRYEEAAKGEAWLRTMIRANVFKGNGMATRGEADAAGGQDVAVYFAREGAPLPDVSGE